MTSAAEFNRRLRAAQRQAEQQMLSSLQKAQREVDAYNRRVEAANRKAVADYNRQAEAHNRRVVGEYNRQAADHNRRAATHNNKVIEEINRRLAAASKPQIRYTPQDEALVDRVQSGMTTDKRDYDLFLSYARIDGASITGELCQHLQSLGVTVWYDELSIQPGKSQALQMDQGLRKARAGAVVLTPAYLTGRFWTERELGALLHKSTLIPVLHNVTFDDVKEYSGILPDLAGFETARDSVAAIAAKIAAAVTQRTPRRSMIRPARLQPWNRLSIGARGQRWPAGDPHHR